jgi:hypothetical protein
MKSSVPVSLQIENLRGTEANAGAAAGIKLPDRARKGDSVFVVTA